MTSSHDEKKPADSKLILSTTTFPTNRMAHLICPINEDHIAECSKFSNTIDIINTKSGKIEKTLEDKTIVTGYEQGISGLVWDGKNIITTTYSGEVERWDINTGKGEKMAFKHPANCISEAHLLSDQQLVVLDRHQEPGMGWQLPVKLLDLKTETSALLFNMYGHFAPSRIIVTETHVIGMLTDKNLVNNKIYIYNLSNKTTKELEHKKEERSYIDLVAASDDIIAISVYDSANKVTAHRVDFYDLQGKKLASLEEQSKNPYRICALPTTGQFCCLGSDSKDNGTLYLVDPRADKLIQQKDSINRSPSHLQYNPITGHLFGVFYDSAKKNYQIIDINIGLKEKYEKYKLELESSDFKKAINEPGITQIVLRQLGMYPDKSPKQDSSSTPTEELKTDKSKKLDR